MIFWGQGGNDAGERIGTRDWSTSGGAAAEGGVSMADVPLGRESVEGVGDAGRVEGVPFLLSRRRNDVSR